MEQGFVKVAAATPEMRVADVFFNMEKHLEIIMEAVQKQVKVLVFPELSITGASCGDIFYRSTLLTAATEAVKTILARTEQIEMLIAVGLPFLSKGKIYNCAAILYKGTLLGLVPKCYLKNYGDSDEKRRFSEAPLEVTTVAFDDYMVPMGSELTFQCLDLPDLSVSFEIGNDLLSPCPPSISHALAGSTIIGNLCAIPEITGKEKEVRTAVSSLSKRILSGYVLANAGIGESTTDGVYAGGNLIAENGAVLSEAAPFANGMIVSEIDCQYLTYLRRQNNNFEIDDDSYETIPFSMTLKETPLSREVPSLPFLPKDSEEWERIITTQAIGLKQRLERSYSKKAVLGISGGLDSTLALLVCAKAMDIMGQPRENVLAVTMPCFGTTERTKSNAEVLCEALRVSFRTVSISDTVLSHFSDIDHDPEDHNVAFENAQARERTQVLMDIANDISGLVVGTGDLSEIALGWATYNGDHMSMYGVNVTIPKTLVRYLVSEYADHSDNPVIKEVLLDILDTPISPELLPAKDGEITQVTEDIVGPYELHDFFLYHFFLEGASPAKLFKLAAAAFDGVYSNETIIKWLTVFHRRFFNQQFKRSCAPDGVKTGPVALSARGDLRMPSDAVSILWQEEINNLL